MKRTKTYARPRRRSRSPYSHSIVLSYSNALNFQRNFFLCAMKHRLADPSEICALDFEDEFSTIRKLLGFSDYRYRLADFLQPNRERRCRAGEKKTVSGQTFNPQASSKRPLSAGNRIDQRNNPDSRQSERCFVAPTLFEVIARSSRLLLDRRGRRFLPRTSPKWSQSCFAATWLPSPRHDLH
jgi:hypothetical protein